MTPERTFQGAWRIIGSDAQGNLVQRLYFFYSKREAMRAFKAEGKVKGFS
jgi:hypothetical protein